MRYFSRLARQALSPAPPSPPRRAPADDDADLREVVVEVPPPGESTGGPRSAPAAEVWDGGSRPIDDPETSGPGRSGGGTSGGGRPTGVVDGHATRRPGAGGGSASQAGRSHEPDDDRRSAGRASRGATRDHTPDHRDTDARGAPSMIRDAGYEAPRGTEDRGDPDRTGPAVRRSTDTPSAGPGAPGTLSHDEALRRALAWVRAGERPGQSPSGATGVAGGDARGGVRADATGSGDGDSPARPARPGEGRGGRSAGARTESHGSSLHPDAGSASNDAAPSPTPNRTDRRVVIEAIEVHVEAPPAPPRRSGSGSRTPTRPPATVQIPPPAPAPAPARLSRHWLRR